MHNLKPAVGAKKSRKRVGRGLGSKGTYSGRGGKGQTARSGVSGLKRLGMKRWVLAQPKTRGFKSLEGKAAVVNVETLAQHFAAGAEVTPAALKEKKLISKTAGRVKILGQGEIKAALKISGCQVSAAAQAKIIAAGGSVA